MTRLFTEIRRRRVLQTIGIYIVSAWVALQVADLAFESWGLPDSAMRHVWQAAFLLTVVCEGQFLIRAVSWAGTSSYPSLSILLIMLL